MLRIRTVLNLTTMTIKKKDIVTICTLIIAIFAIVISIRSCQISNQVLKLTEQEYSDKFQTIWTFRYLPEKEVFQIEPSNKNVNLQNGIAYYPDSISNTEWPIRLPENFLYMTSPKLNIGLQVKNKITAIDSSFLFLDNGSVPILLESYYTINGENFYDISLYMLRFTAVIYDNPYRNPEIKLIGLTYSSRFDEKLDKKQFLNEFWSKLNEQWRNIQ